MKNILKSPVFYAYLILYIILFVGKGSYETISLIIGIVWAVILSLINTKVIYLVISFINSQEKLFLKFMLVPILILTILVTTFLSLYTLEIKELIFGWISR